MVLFEIIGAAPCSKEIPAEAKMLPCILGDALSMPIEVELRMVFSIMHPEQVCSLQLLLTDVKPIDPLLKWI